MSTPTPTDPREEPSETGMPCASDHGVKVLLAEDKEPIDPKDTEIAKLADEIAELKERESKALDEARHWHQRLVLTDYAILGNDDAIRRLCEEDAEFKSASQILSLQNARALRAELEAANAREEFLKSKGLTVGTLKASNHEPKLAYVIEPESELCDLRYIHENLDLKRELEAARKERDERKADLKMFMEMHDTALAAKDAAEKENKELREREGQLVIKWEGQQDRANQLESKLATLCAAKEKRVAEALPIISDALSELSLTLANTERRESADCRLAAYLKASRASELIAALTPAPTQEPPAGGATAKPHIVIDDRYFADVQPEGRGELLPFNLSDALAGKSVVTRDGRFTSKLQGTDRLLGGTVNGIYYNWYLDGKCTNGNPLHDLFMLSTEGSRA